MSRLLEPNELVCFGFSHFDCEARRRCDMADDIEVVVKMFRGDRFLFRCGPSLTLAELQELTAYRILDYLRDVSKEAQNYAKRVREESCLTS